ncbi:MAG: hypothetical protein D6B25_00195 [Desulfobulbaceae bacterium]|nr:MAG: hypothetical protein D6B25_00195 [Desulfobulbaceae bacterium]
MRSVKKYIRTVFLSMLLILPPMAVANEARMQTNGVEQSSSNSGSATQHLAIPDPSTRNPTQPSRINTKDLRESDEMKRARASSLPDLIVEKFTVSPHKLSSGDKVTLRATIRNKGSKSLRNVRIVYLEGITKLAEDRISIGAGKIALIEKRATLNNAGNVKLEINVDPQQLIKETDKKNNKKTKMVVVTKPKAHAETAPIATFGNDQTRNVPKSIAIAGRARLNPDLFPVRLALNKKQFSPGQSVVIKLTLKNSGPGSVEKVPVKLYVNDREVGSTFSSIPANNTDLVIFRHKFEKAGNYTLSATIDPGNKVEERNERNNTISDNVDVIVLKIADKLDHKQGGNLQTIDDRIPATVKNRQPVASLHDSALEKSRSRQVGMDNVAEIKKLPELKTYSSNTFIGFELPNNNSKWQLGQRYDIKWYVIGNGQVNVTRLRLLDLRGNTAPTDITPKTITKYPGSNKQFGFSYLVPNTTTSSLYHLALDYTGIVNGKKKTLQAVSQPFFISWKGDPLTIQKIPDHTDPLDALLELAAKKPYISYFEYSKNDSKFLNVKFYWKDQEGDLAGGRWNLEILENGKWQKMSKKFTDELLTHPQVTGKQGLAHLTIPLKNQPAQTQFKFYVTDKAGWQSNVMTGIANPLQNIVPATLEFLEFVTPAPKSSPGNAAIPVAWVSPGEQYTIQLKAQVLDNSITSIPVELSLAQVGSLNKIGVVNVPTNGTTFNYNWVVPNSVKNAPFIHFIASAPLVSKKPIQSGTVAVTNYQLTLTKPTPGQTWNTPGAVPFEWSVPQSIPAGETLDFFYLPKGGSTMKKVNTTPVSVGKKAWLWGIDPATVAAGDATILIRSSSSGLSPVAVVPINIRFQGAGRGVGPLKFTFISPSSLSTSTQWLAGESELVEWKLTGGSPYNISLELRPVGGATLAQPAILPLVPNGSASPYSNKTYFRVPSNAEDGPYRLVAIRDDFGTVVAQSPVIDVVSSATLNSMLPKPDTKFSIAKVDYPYQFANQARVLIFSNATVPFKLSGAMRQKVTLKVSNYGMYGVGNWNPGGSTVVISKTISSDIDSHLFPNRTILAGQYGYNLNLLWPGSGQPTIMAVKQDKATGLFEPGGLCVTRYYPKLEVWLDTTLSDGTTRTTYYKKFIKNSNILKEKYVNLGGETGNCKDEREW